MPGWPLVLGGRGGGGASLIPAQQVFGTVCPFVCLLVLFVCLFIDGCVVCGGGRGGQAGCSCTDFCLARPIHLTPLFLASLLPCPHPACPAPHPPPLHHCTPLLFPGRVNSHFPWQGQHRATPHLSTTVPPPLPRVSTGRLNRFVRKLSARLPGSGPATELGRLKYLAQVKARPPCFAAFMSGSRPVDQAFTRFLSNQMREVLGFQGVPLRLWYR